MRRERIEGGVRAGSPWWLNLVVPIALLAIGGSIGGIVVDDVYAAETANWSAQGMGQDVANLVAFPVLLLMAFFARRGSLPAWLACSGVLAYSVYSYAIYAFDVHFGPLFLLYVAVFGLSIWALIGSLSTIEIARVGAAFAPGAPVRSTSMLLILIGVVFALLWLSEIVPATITGETPASLTEAGLTTNPVHVLDLGVLLPAAIAAGILLRRRAAWGYVLAAVVLGALVFLSIGIIAAMTVLAVRDQGGSLGIAAGLSVLTVVELVVWLRFLAAARNEEVEG